MNIKEQWVDDFQEKLWEYHTCDWAAGNRNPDYPYQLAVAYFDYDQQGQPMESVDSAFGRYLEGLNETINH